MKFYINLPTSFKLIPHTCIVRSYWDHVQVFEESRSCCVYVLLKEIYSQETLHLHYKINLRCNYPYDHRLMALHHNVLTCRFLYCDISRKGMICKCLFIWKDSVYLIIFISLLVSSRSRGAKGGGARKAMSSPQKLFEQGALRW